MANLRPGVYRTKRGLVRVTVTDTGYLIRYANGDVEAVRA